MRGRGGDQNVPKVIVPLVLCVWDQKINTVWNFRRRGKESWVLFKN